MGTSSLSLFIPQALPCPGLLLHAQLFLVLVPLCSFFHHLRGLREVPRMHWGCFASEGYVCSSLSLPSISIALTLNSSCPLHTFSVAPHGPPYLKWHVLIPLVSRHPLAFASHCSIYFHTHFLYFYFVFVKNSHRSKGQRKWGFGWLSVSLPGT